MRLNDDSFSQQTKWKNNSPVNLLLKDLWFVFFGCLEEKHIHSNYKLQVWRKRGILTLRYAHLECGRQKNSGFCMAQWVVSQIFFSVLNDSVNSYSLKFYSSTAWDTFLTNSEWQVQLGRDWKFEWITKLLLQFPLDPYATVSNKQNFNTCTGTKRTDH